LAWPYFSAACRELRHNSVRTLYGVEAAPLSGLPERGEAEFLIGQCCQFDQPRRAGHIRNDEPVEVWASRRAAG
jgi:hypothetical protein